jgi:hypothetical protein
VITVVGCGFLGGLFIEEVAKRAFAYHEDEFFVLIDPDDIEDRNVANQIWAPDQVGMPKVMVLMHRLNAYGLQANVHAERVEESNVKDALTPDNDIIVCAVDNIPSRQLLWKQAVAMGVPLLTMGISQGGTGSIDWTDMTKGFDTNPFSPMRLAGMSDERIAKLGKVGHLPPCELVGFRGLGLNTSLAAAKALWIYKGWDAEREVLKVPKGEAGTMSTWESTNHLHRLTGASK